MASEEELRRRAEEARVRAILEPKDEQAREEFRRKRREEEERRAAAVEQHKTHRLATLFLIALAATAVLAMLRWLLSDG